MESVIHGLIKSHRHYDMRTSADSDLKKILLNRWLPRMCHYAFVLKWNNKLVLMLFSIFNYIENVIQGAFSKEELSPLKLNSCILYVLEPKTAVI